MVNHVVHTFYALNLAAINEHVPMSFYNESTGDQAIFCKHCGWEGRVYKGRWADKTDEQWAIHAADIAMRREPKGGEKHVNCWCADCARVRRLAAEGVRRG